MRAISPRLFVAGLVSLGFLTIYCASPQALKEAGIKPLVENHKGFFRIKQSCSGGECPFAAECEIFRDRFTSRCDMVDFPAFDGKDHFMRGRLHIDGKTVQEFEIKITPDETVTKKTVVHAYGKLRGIELEFESGGVLQEHVAMGYDVFPLGSLTIRNKSGKDLTLLPGLDELVYEAPDGTVQTGSLYSHSPTSSFVPAGKRVSVLTNASVQPGGGISVRFRSRNLTIPINVETKDAPFRYKAVIQQDTSQ